MNKAEQIICGIVSLFVFLALFNWILAIVICFFVIPAFLDEEYEWTARTQNYIFKKLGLKRRISTMYMEGGETK